MPGVKQVTSPSFVTLKIASEEKLGRSVNTICNANIEIINKIKEAITSNIMKIDIVDRARDVDEAHPYANIGINADSINDVIRDSLRTIEGLCFETNVEHGGFFERNRKSDFDFSFYDRMFNYCGFWNFNKNERNLEQIIESTIQDRDIEGWNEFKETYNPQPGIEVEYIGNEVCNIIGEIQMGNWAMVYKDIFRLLRAKNSPGVHLYIYITNTGFLEESLSTSIVTYKKALKEFKEYLDIIGVPILILGVDVDEYSQSHFVEAHNIVKRKKEIIKTKQYDRDSLEEALASGSTLEDIEQQVFGLEEDEENTNSILEGVQTIEISGDDSGHFIFIFDEDGTNILTSNERVFPLSKYEGVEK